MKKKEITLIGVNNMNLNEIIKQIDGQYEMAQK